MQLRLSTPLPPADQSNLQAHLIPFVKHTKYYPNSFVAALMENKKMSLLITPPQILIKLVYCWTLCLMTFADSTDVASGHHTSTGNIYLFVSVEQSTINLFCSRRYQNKGKDLLFGLILYGSNYSWLTKIEPSFSFTPSVTRSVSLQFIVNF